MINTDKLAHDNRLCRKILSVREDEKKGRWCITIEVSQLSEQGIKLRDEVDYYLFDKEEDFDINAALTACKSFATLKYMGLPIPGEVMESPKEEVKEAPKEEVKEETKEEAKPEPEEEPAEEKPKAKRKKASKAVKKKAATKVAKKKAAAAPKVEEEEEEGPELDLVELDEDDSNVLYDKANVAHAHILRDLVVEMLGANWKTEKSSVKAVKSLVAKINGKVAVTDGDGEALASFTEFVEANLEEG